MRVLVVEDSPTQMAYLRGILRSEPDIELLEPATTGVQGVRLAVAERPDIIVMDLHLAEMDGLEAIGHIMAIQPCPIVVLSAELGRADIDLTFESLRAGAVDALPKPGGGVMSPGPQFRETLLSRLRLLSQVRVVRRSHRQRQPVRATQQPPPQVEAQQTKVVVIGASTGGPPVLYELLKRLPRPPSLPVVISQHISAGSELGMCRWFRGSGHDVRVAVDGEELQAGRIYVSPADGHAVLTSATRLGIAPLGDATIAPSVDQLFASAATHLGPNVIAVLLTGMGSDGAKGMAALHAAGALTVAQSAETCVVNGMPGSAVALGAVRQVLSPDGIAAMLCAAMAQVRAAAGDKAAK